MGASLFAQRHIPRHRRVAPSLAFLAMRGNRTAQGWILSSAFAMLLLEFWALVIMSRWLVIDSYALDHFPKAHPVLGFLAEFLWIAGDFGAVFLLGAGLLALYCWLMGRQPREH